MDIDSLNAIAGPEVHVVGDVRDSVLRIGGVGYFDVEVSLALVVVADPLAALVEQVLIESSFGIDRHEGFDFAFAELRSLDDDFDDGAAEVVVQMAGGRLKMG